MAGKYSIHDTHRLPYNNAKITAKQLSDSTTPVRFRTFTGEIIGLEVRTNSRGYCCQSDGTPYVDGVFVEEDAIVTAVMPDGSSTSWTVGGESDLTVFDGKLYGRVIEDPNEYSDDDVIIGNTHYKRLFSANQQGDTPLSLNDLANVPSFTKWTDDQQIERFNVGMNTANPSYTLYIRNQTKVLILANNNSQGKTQVYPKQFTVFLHAQVDQDGKTRFGRNFSVFNTTGMAITLKNATGTQQTVGTVQTGSALEVAETYPSAQPGSDNGGQALFVAVNNWELASNGGVSYTIPNNGGGGADFIEINDSTPPILNIADVMNKQDLPQKVVMVKYDGNKQTFRRIILRRFDGYNRSLALVNENNQALGILPPFGNVELTVAKDNAGNPYSGLVNNIKPWMQQQVITLVPNNNNQVAAGIGVVSVNAAAATTSFTSLKTNLVFSNGVEESYRIEFTGNPAPCWIRLVDANGLEGDSFCVPASGGRVIVHNVYGVVKLVSKSWSSTAVDYHNTGNREYLLKYNSFDVVFDLSEISFRDWMYGTDMGEYKYDAIAAFPIASGQTALVRMKIPFYGASGGDYNGDCRFGFGGTDNTFSLNNSWMGANEVWYDHKDDENWFAVGGHIIEGILSRSGNTYSFTLNSTKAIE